MKTARKVLLLVLCAALLVSATVMGTLAYLSSTTKQVKNTFTVGKVELNGDLGNGLDEAKTDKYGVVDEDADPARVLANEYTLIPGMTYTKDPTVHVAKGSEECYLFVKVTNSIYALEAATVKNDDGDVVTDTIANQMTALGWTLVTGHTDVYYYKDTVDARDAQKDVVVFNNFTIAYDADVSGVTSQDAITITAYAVQAEGFDDANDAWTAAPCDWVVDT